MSELIGVQADMGSKNDPELIVLQQQLARLKQSIVAGEADSLPLVEMLLRDTQRRVAAERDLIDARTWMDLAQDAGGVATYRMDITANRLWWSNSVFGLYGMVPDEGEPTVERWLSTIHPDDRDDVAAVARAAIELGRAVDHCFRIVLDTGELRWVHDRGSVERDEQGRPSWLHGVNIDVTALRQTQDNLVRSEERFRSAFEHANVGVAHVAPSGKFLQVNRYLCALLGRDAAQLSELTFQDLTHPDDLGGDLHLLERLVAGEIPSYTMEKRYIRPDGDVVWADLSVSLLRDGEGQPLNFVSVITDIEARKKAQNHLELVLAEANHRVKNLLSVVSTIVINSAKSVSTTVELVQAVLQRIQGIAASHDLLTGKTAMGGDLGQLIRRQLEIFTDCDASRVELRGPRITLNSAAVHAFGMILHELATNACKYGALSDHAGRVKIRWSIDRNAENLQFEWLEYDGPKIASVQRQGFGTKALSRMLSGSLGGSVVHEFPADGARFIATVPLANSVLS